MGHLGTLDPLASGVLPVAIGEATKAIPYVDEREKEYNFTICWGEQRTTDDQEGEIVKISAVRPTSEQVRSVLPRFLGSILQTPPIYSAIKIKGKRACDRVRAGEKIELEAREVNIHGLTYLGSDEQDYSHFQVRCGSGTYVRSLVRDMAHALDTVGYAASIHRTRVGCFKERDAIFIENDIETLAKDRKKVLLDQYIHAIRYGLDDIPAVQVSSAAIDRLLKGQPLFDLDLEDQKVLLCCNEYGIEVAIAEVRSGCLYPKRIFNLMRKE